MRCSGFRHEKDVRVKQPNALVSALQNHVFTAESWIGEGVGVGVGVGVRVDNENVSVGRA